MFRIVLLALIVVMAGCADRLAERKAYLSHFVGQPEALLLQQMGVPTRSYETSGEKFLAYDERRLDIVPTLYNNGPFFMGWYGGGFPPEVIDLQCETTFEVSGGVVKTFTLRGNACG